MINAKARCGHFAPESYIGTHNGLCRRCHSDFAYLLDLEEKYGEDALIEYWYGMILAHSREGREADCFIDHLIEFYQRKLVEIPSKQKYSRKMLYMLKSVKEPTDIDSLR